MTKTRSIHLAADANNHAQAHFSASVAAEKLSLAAAPTFALMAGLTHFFGTGPMDAFCSAGHAFPLSGMVPMYLLMSAFHSSPWLKLVSDRRAAARSRES